MTPTEIERARKLCEAATPGPWTWWNLERSDKGWNDNGPNLHREGDEETVVVAGYGYDAWGIEVQDADAAFIAASRQLVPDLLAALDLARAALAERDAVIDLWRDAIVQRRLGPSLRAPGWMDREAELMGGAP